MNAGLTLRQAKLLDVISSRTVHGVPPTYAAMARELETSRGGIHALLLQLKERGFVTWDFGRHRSLRLVDPLAGKTNADLRAMRARIDRALMERGA